jgi:glycosyltransferase involved in cell wall biosynthesis
MDIAVIPAYNPDKKLLELVENLRDSGLEEIIVVNDGSVSSTLHIFSELKNYVTLINHEYNQGKGAAIKTALAYIDRIPGDKIEGIVLLDADGQHRVCDALRLLKELRQKQDSLVLGVRKFKGKIPFRSLFGNTVTKFVFRMISGQWVSDTQTGLRAVSKAMVPKLITIKGERYEYEMNVLLTCAKSNIPITEVPIETIYHDEKNTCSHFRTIRDSVRIYGNILAFSGTSFLSFLLDYILFFILVQIFMIWYLKADAVVFGNIAARLLSGAFNYYLNSTFIFHDEENRLKSITSYAMLAGFILLLNTAILYILYDYIGLNRAIAKLITELLLFIISFTVQKFIIFSKAPKRRNKVSGGNNL